jgi:hypothetical protein
MGAILQQDQVDGGKTLTRDRARSTLHAPPSSREPGSYEEMPSPGHTRSQHSDARRARDLGTHVTAPSEARRPGPWGRSGIPLISR